MNRWTSTAATILALAVILGAFGAHGLELSDRYREIYEKAVFYHFIHGLGILLVAQARLSKLNLICGLFTMGIIFFSGSLYLLAISQLGWLGAITPIGGLSFISAWIILAVSKSNQRF